MNDNKTDVMEFLGECNAGALIEKLALVLNEAAQAQVLNNVGNKKAQVGLVFTFQQIGDNDQVAVSHKLSKVIPTNRGKKAEEDTTDTAFFVGKGGKLTINPPKEDTDGQFNLKATTDKATGEIRRIN